jgi:hypothetical protein
LEHAPPRKKTHFRNIWGALDVEHWGRKPDVDFRVRYVLKPATVLIFFQYS